MNLSIILAVAAILAVVLTAGCVTTDSPQSGDGMVTITDAFGREVTIPENPEKIAVVGLEALDGTPVLDIKPYSKDIDTPRE